MGAVRCAHKFSSSGGGGGGGSSSRGEMYPPRIAYACHPTTLWVSAKRHLHLVDLRHHHTTTIYNTTNLHEYGYRMWEEGGGSSSSVVGGGIGSLCRHPRDPNMVFVGVEKRLLLMDVR